MIILQPNKELRRDLLIKDEAALNQKIKDNEAVVIIPSEYDIVSMDDTCEIVKIDKIDNESMTATEKAAYDELRALGKVIRENFKVVADNG